VAADMALKAPPVPAPVWTWTGFYLGLEGGWNGGLGQATTGTSPANITNGFTLSGGLVGGTFGYNWQVNRFWLVGLEADGSWTNKSGAGPDAAPFNANFTNQFNEQWLTTFRARLGWVPAEGGLIYITGGGAAAGVQQRVFDNPPICGGGTPFPCAAVSQTNTLWGFSAGAGVEWRVLQNLSFKAEFIYIGLQTKSYFNPAPITPNAAFLNDQRVNLSDQVIRLGVNYRFNWIPGPVGGPY